VGQRYSWMQFVWMHAELELRVGINLLPNNSSGHPRKILEPSLCPMLLHEVTAI
jgi:hypothetical protein